MNNYEDTSELKENDKRRYIIPIVIILVGVLIALLIFDTRTNSDGNISVLDNSQLEFALGVPENIRAINTDDHILGNPNAPVKIVEFSDFECPFCKVFHFIMTDVMDTYGKSGEVAWVYRHIPLDSIHSNARKEAVASECANEIGGNTAFWKYADKIFEITTSNNTLDLGLLPEIAKEIGLDREEFEICLESGRHDERIENDFRDAINSGANGTPYSIVIAPNGKTFLVAGSQTYSTLSSIINIALKER